ncbi:PGF-CTERM-anchored ABC transporter substrate-binding protein [Natronorubrum halophilum]|uniref:PGF-CTERM-anchored ABC transporter substrate-binding protein n=1 Tax=Natronorubrum halophilum TaxID=1702106 RepID=UPI001EE7FEB2|nr:PGF-CTERM-anchored ABC transporter substrate-binding protein [Natronorubrum halophilum]
MHRAWSMLVVSIVIVGAFAPITAVGAAAGNGVVSAEPSSEGDCQYPITETDGTGTEVTLEEAPETVVTLNPSLAQTMWEIGAEERVIGLTSHAENLEGAENRTSVSTDDATIDPEIVVDLDADLVLATSSQYVTEEMIETLRESGQTVYYFPAAESIDDVRERTHLVGSLVDECAGATETVDWMDEELEVVNEAVEGEDRPDVLYTFFGFTAGEGTFINELIEAGGGTNVAAEAGIDGYQEPDAETVVDANPEWLVLNTNSPDVPETPAYEATAAVQNDRTLIVDINHLNRPGPRIVHAITAFAEAFHPDAYAEAGVSDDSSQSADGSERSETTDEVPGFGVGLTTVAVSLAVLSLATLSRIRHGHDRS